MSYLGRRSTDGPAAVHRRLVQRPGFEEGSLRLSACGLVMGQSGGTVTDAGVSPHRHFVHRARRQVSGCKQEVHVE